MVNNMSERESLVERLRNPVFPPGNEALFLMLEAADTIERLTSSRPLILEEAAKVAERGCLVPPDGGSPTEAEREMCEAIAAAIRSLATETGNAE